jgi:type III pantothenate kinase
VSAAAELVVDLGHSRVKWGRCRDGDLLAASVRSAPLDQPEALFAEIERQPVRHLLWSAQSHGAAVDRLGNEFRALGVSCRAVTTGAPVLPVAAAYPELGTDRWLALQWPWLRSRRALCVVDCGTAVTVDAVDGRGHHRGGWIMAGLSTMSRGLGQAAPRLPAPELEAEGFLGPAIASAPAIGRGFRLQLIGGIRQALAELRQALGTDFDCWLTGGDAPWVADALDRPVHHDPHLVLRGLALAGPEP